LQEASRNTIVWFFLALFLLSCFLLGWLLLPFLSIIVVAAVVTGIFKPLYERFKRRVRPGTASFITCVVIFLVLFIPILLIVGVLSKEAYDMYIMARGVGLRNHIQGLFESSELLEQAGTALAHFNIRLTGEEINQAIPEIGKIVGLFLYEQANAVASNVMRFLVNFFFMLLVAYFLLIDGDRLISFIIDLCPLPEDQEEKLIGKFRDMAGAIIVGNGLCGLIQGVAGGIAFALAGLPSAFLWGVVMAILAFLPILGIGLVLVPAAVYLMLAGRVLTGMIFLIFYVMLSGGVEYLVKPRLVGSRVQMHTLLVFLAIIGGLKLFGILGILYGPLVVTAFLTLTDIYNTSYRNLVRSV
jgi:predicted PurR-regulated permease PerM